MKRIILFLLLFATFTFGGYAQKHIITRRATTVKPKPKPKVVDQDDVKRNKAMAVVKGIEKNMVRAAHSPWARPRVGMCPTTMESHATR